MIAGAVSFHTPLALLQGGFADIFTNPATAWVIIPLLIFAIPIVEAIISPINMKIKSGERDRMRQMYERLTMEKLDIIKTAVAVGYQTSELRELDERLRSVIGEEEMHTLMNAKLEPEPLSRTKERVTRKLRKSIAEAEDIKSSELDTESQPEATRAQSERS